MLSLRPSPEDLLAALPEDELIILDLLFEKLPLDGKADRESFDALATDAGLSPKDQQLFRQAVPDENRRGYLISLVRQVRQLGISIRPRTRKDAP